MNLTTFLNDQELVELTGYKQARKQIQILHLNRIPFYTNKRGEPRVPREILTRASGKLEKSKKEKTEVWKPAVLEGFK